MSSTSLERCAPVRRELGVTPPPPGLRRLDRRFGDFHAFVDDLRDRIQRQKLTNGEPLARVWDVEGDPEASLLVELWAFVAEGVAAYSELTAGEAYIGTAADWTDLRRLAALVGYRPTPRVAAQGWVRAEVDRGADPVVPAGTRVQAAATPTRSAQTFEVADDTQLRGEWDGLTATWPLKPKPIAGRTIRFASDPGFDAGDQVLVVDTGGWGSGWGIPLAVVSVEDRADEVGTTLLTFDRDLGWLNGAGAPRGYRVVASATPARRLEKIVSIPLEAKTITNDNILAVPYGDAAIDNTGKTRIVLDAFLDELSPGAAVAVVVWDTEWTPPNLVLPAEVTAHVPVEWAVAPGTVARRSQIDLSVSLGHLFASIGALTIHVLDRAGGEALKHYEPESTPPHRRLRLHPGPAVAPPHLAVETAVKNPDGTEALTWEVFGCTPVSASGQRKPGDPLLVELDGTPAGVPSRARASGNVFRVRHGTSASAVLGSGNAGEPNQRFAVPDAPIAYDLDETGAPASSLVVRVDGVRWDEVPTLYEAGAAQAYTTRLHADGAVTVEGGDGEQGRRFATGRENVTGAWRAGGGRRRRARVGGDRCPSRQRPRREESERGGADVRRLRPG